MDQQTITDELSATGAHELLASTAAAHLSYVGQDTTPRDGGNTPDQARALPVRGRGRMPGFLTALANKAGA